MVCESLYFLDLDLFIQVVIKVQEIQAFTDPYKYRYHGPKHQVHQERQQERHAGMFLGIWLQVICVCP